LTVTSSGRFFSGRRFGCHVDRFSSSGRFFSGRRFGCPVDRLSHML
jgi:hypothetical protein